MVNTKLAVLAALLLSCVSTQRVDQTTVPGSNGVNVVRAVLARLDESGIFQRSGNSDLTNVFLRNMAYVETRDGRDLPQSAVAIDGGIWKITPMQFQQTKELSSRHDRVYDAIAAHLGQEWRDLEYRDLEKPLYSGLAARLYLMYVATYSIIPPTARQGLFWSEKFKGGKGDLQLWLAAISLLQQTEVCSVNTDVVFVLDSSGSINNADPSNYDKVKNFTRAFVDALIDGNSEGEEDRIGIVLYGTYGEVYLQLNESESLDKQSLLERMKGIPYRAGWTNTADGLCHAIEQSWRNSLSILRLVITLTDGRSNRDSPLCGNTTSAARLVHANNPPLLSYAIGVANANEQELLTIATTPELVDHLDSFNTDLLTAAQEARSYQICFTVDQPQIIGQPVKGTTGQGTGVRISFSAPAEEGITVRFCVSEGQIVLYASTSVPNPSAVLNDWSTTITSPQYQHTLVCSTTFFNDLDSPNLMSQNLSPGKSTRTRSRRQVEQAVNNSTVTLYIAIEGQDNFNEFSLNSSHGEFTFDVNECLLNPCHINADCNNTDGSFNCECQTGFSGDGFQCLDINECEGEHPPCHSNAVCLNTLGNFTCTCAEGYHGDGTTSCQDIGMRLFIVLLPAVNGLGLAVLGIIAVLLVMIKCRQKKFKGSTYERNHSTVII